MNSLNAMNLQAEMAKARAHLAEKRKRFDELDILVSGEVINMREIINPFLDDVTKLDVESGSAVMTSLSSHVKEMRTLMKEIDKLKLALGEND